MAKKKKLVDQDFNQNEIQNAVDQNLATAPSNPKEGQFYWDTANKEDMIWNGTAWVSRTSQGKIYTGGTGIDVNGTTISVDTTIAAKTDIGDGKIIYQKNGTAFATASVNQTSTVTVNYTIPTQASDISAVPTSRTVNGKALSSNITLTASDVGALPDTTTIGAGDTEIQRNGTAIGTINANQTASGTINISVPTTASDVGALPSSTVIGDGKIIYQKNGTAFATASVNQTSTVTVNYTIPTQASDIGALPDTTTIGDGKVVFKKNGTAFATATANQTSTVNVNYSIPTTASDVGALPSSTTITDLVSTTQMDAINSGVTTSIVAQVGTNASDISDIEGLIPTQATTSNQLADKNFVNSSVQTATANFRGNWATWADVPTVASSYPEDYAGSKTPTVNDYLVVQDASGYTGETLTGTWRFKYSGDWATNGKNGWLPEYQVNETPLTSAQLAAINSGITSTLVAQIGTNATNISGLSTSKQDKLTAGSNITISGNTISATDTTYSAGANITISGGTISATDTIYTLPAATTNTLGGVKVGSNLTVAADGTLSALAQSITVDTTLSTTSTNPVQNKVVTSAIAAKSSVTFVDWTV